MSQPRERVRIVYASELPECGCCGEPWCPEHEDHFAECACIGPHNAEDEGYTLVEIEGVLYGEKVAPPLPAAREPWNPCPACRGRGWVFRKVSNMRRRTGCATCGGKGQLPIDNPAPTPEAVRSEPWPADALMAEQMKRDARRKARKTTNTHGGLTPKCRCACGLRFTVKGIAQHQRACAVQQARWAAGASRP